MQGTSISSLSEETKDLESHLMSKYPHVQGLSSYEAVTKCVARAAAAVVEKAAQEQIGMAVERLIVEVEGSPTCDDKEGKDNVVVVSTYLRQ